LLRLGLPDVSEPLEVLCIGAHSDDLEIGCAATLLHLLERGHRLRVTWVVLSALGERGQEATRSAKDLLRSASDLSVHLGTFADSHFPGAFSELKRYFAEMSRAIDPAIVFTHCLEDRHQDHRLVGELTWQTWRQHLILEYDVPKFEGEWGRPNVFVPVPRSTADAKVAHLMQHFGSQRTKDWFSPDTFLASMRLRGIECRSQSGLAEAFISRKIVL